MKRRQQPLTADLTPLIDVVFLLLIFFLVSSVFKKQELALLLNLPKTENYEKSVSKKQINIELNTNKLALNGEILSFKNLTAKLKNIKSNKVPVIIRIDEQVNYKRVTKLLDTLQEYNLNNIMLVSKG